MRAGAEGEENYGKWAHTGLITLTRGGVDNCGRGEKICRERDQSHEWTQKPTGKKKRGEKDSWLIPHCDQKDWGKKRKSAGSK